MSISIHDAVTAKRENGQRGFTLIELLVVVIIIGILAAIAIPIFLGQQEQARGSAAQSAVTNAKTSLVSALVDDGEIDAGEITGVQEEYTAGQVTVVVNVASDNAFCISATHAGVSTDEEGNVWSTTEATGVVRAPCPPPA